MKSVADLLFEAYILKKVPRSGFHFLGVGKESVAEHSFCATFIAYVMAQMTPSADALRLISMCLIHDLPEARTGDLNYVHKRYVTADEKAAVSDMVADIPFGGDISGLMAEFNEGRTEEARLARDADQLAFILDLKQVSDIGCPAPEKWLPHVRARLCTDIGHRIADAIMERSWDDWWEKDYSE